MTDDRQTNISDNADVAQTISAVVITKDEEVNIGRCLNSVAWADEIIVVDSGSNDDTRLIATEAGAFVYEIVWAGFGPAKMFATEKASSKWILSIDADEVVSSELAKEIQDLLIKDTNHHGYDMPRKTNFLGRWIHHCGWYPDRVLRLFKKSHGNFNDAPIHEQVVLNGEIGHLRGELLHYSYPTLEHYLVKSNCYTTLGAKQALQDGRRASWFDLVVRPVVSFISHYVSRQGFRDGLEGLLISVLSAVAVMVKYAKLRTLQRERDKKEN